MRTPGEMLKDFEDKHGGFDELVYKISKFCRDNLSESDRQEKRRLEQLLRRHNELVWMLTGYQIAKEEEKK